MLVWQKAHDASSTNPGAAPAVTAKPSPARSFATIGSGRREAGGAPAEGGGACPRSSRERRPRRAADRERWEESTTWRHHSRPSIFLVCESGYPSKSPERGVRSHRCFIFSVVAPAAPHLPRPLSPRGREGRKTSWSELLFYPPPLPGSL